MTTFAELRARALGPFLYSHCVRDGVLRDVGLAAQEMPTSTGGGSYTGYLHTLNPSQHDAMMSPLIRGHPDYVKGSDMTALRDAVLTYGAMPIGEVSTVYATGPFLCLQTVGCAPRMVGDDPEQYDYTSALNTILSEWPGRPIMVNCGAATHEGFPSGEQHFTNRFGVVCRAADNVLRVGVDSATFGIEPTRFVHQVELPCADGVARHWLRTVTDSTHPTFVAMVLEHVAALAQEFGTQLRYLCHGESGITFFKPGSVQEDCASITAANCSGCEPATNVAPHLVAGFRAWLQEALGLDTAEMNARWQSAFDDFDDVDPGTDPFCPATSRAIRDYRDFQSFVLQEVGWETYREAKKINPQVSGTKLGFGTVGMEVGSLQGDGGAVGDWHGEPRATYLADREFIFRPISSAARLHGVPCQFPLTVSTHVPAPSDTVWPIGLPPIFRAHRMFTPIEVRWLFRDLLTAGAVGFGYLRTPTAAINWHEPSRDAVLDTIGEMVDMHPHAFAGCGPYQRLAVHIDPEDQDNMRRPEQSAGAARTGYWLHQEFRDRHAAVAIMHDDRVLERNHARTVLAQSIVFVPYHTGAEDLVDTYRELFPEGAPGGAVFIEENITGTVPFWVIDEVVAATHDGALYRVVDSLGDDPVNCWYFAARPEQPCRLGDKHWRRIATTMRDHVVRAITPHIDDVGGVPWLATPLVVSSADLALQTNYVTGGINFTVAISNISEAGNVSTDVGIAPEIAAALDVSYTTQSLSLAAGETQFLTFNATPNDALDVGAAIEEAEVKLATLGDYVTTDAAALLAHAASLVATHPSRALEQYLAATRMPLLNADHVSGLLVVSVVRLGLVGEADSIPIAGAGVQVLWPLNRREEGAADVTDGFGAASFAIGAPMRRRWDLAANAFADPSPTDGSVAEVHVTDPATGASTRQLVSLS